MVGPAIFMSFLLLCLVYAVPVVLAVLGLRNLLASKKRQKPAKGVIQLVFAISLLSYFLINHHRSKRREVEAQLGTYELEQYPGCHPCSLELQENNIFVVKSNNVIKEIGQWHYESGQDYWITYLNEHDQLGFGSYKYTSYKLKHPPIP